MPRDAAGAHGVESRLAALDLLEDGVDDAFDRGRGVDRDAVARYVASCLMPLRDASGVWCSSRAPVLARSCIEALSQGLQVDLEYEDAIEKVDEGVEVSRPSAEERQRFVVVLDEIADALHIPDVVLVGCPTRALPGLGVALVGQLPVAMHRLEPTSLQLRCHRRLAGTRQPLDQVVPDSHKRRLRGATLPHHHGSGRSREQANEAAEKQRVTTGRVLVGQGEDVPSSSIVVELRPIARGPWWVLAGVIASVVSVFSVTVGVVTGVFGGIAVPLHKVLVRDRLSREVLVEFDPPLFKGKQVAALVSEEAEQLDREVFLRRWSSEEARRQQLLAAGVQRL